MNSTPWLTIVVVFYNNQREAERTLFTLSNDYQQELSNNEYKVIAIDNNSPKPLSTENVTKFGENFNYHFFETDLPSPCAALNWGIKQANTPYVMCMIDGAHMLSPRVLIETKSVLTAFPNAFVYTVPFHLGETLQNESMLRGYNQKLEDELLNSINWKENGHGLFTISEVRNANHSFFTLVNESNCFTINRDKILEKGGFDEAFISIGGGLTNLDIFNQLVEDENTKPVALVGEASFHQYHGGVSTNIERKDHPIGMYKEEYKRIKGKNYGRSAYTPYYWGVFNKELTEYMPVSSYKEVLRLARKMALNEMADSAIDMLLTMKAYQKQHPAFHSVLGFCYMKNDNTQESLKAYKTAHNMGDNKTVEIATILIKLGQLKKAISYLEKDLELRFDKPLVLIIKAQVHSRLKQFEISRDAFQKAYNILQGSSKFIPRAYTEAFWYSFRRKKYNAASHVLRIALQHYPDGVQFIRFQGKVLIAQGNYTKAENFLLKSLNECNPKSKPGLFITLSECYVADNKKQKAIKILNEGIMLFPTNIYLKNVLNRLST